MLYECLLLFGVLVFTFLVPQVAVGMLLQTTLPGPLLVSHVAAVMLVYFVWFWRHGQTLAMQTWKLRIISAWSGGQITGPQAVLRFALCWPSVACFGAGLVWALFDRDRQFLHDRLAGTRVVTALASLDPP